MVDPSSGLWQSCCTPGVQSISSFPAPAEGGLPDKIKNFSTFGRALAWPPRVDLRLQRSVVVLRAGDIYIANTLFGVGQKVRYSLGKNPHTVEGVKG